MGKMKIQRWYVSILAALLLVSLVGCGSGAKAPKAEDLKVSVEEQIKDGEHKVVFWFENNSKFTITYLQVRYKVKDEITKEAIEANFDYSYGLPEGWTVKDVFMDGIVGDEYQSEFSKDDAVEVKPKETSPKTELHRNNIFFVTDIAEFENMTPDVMTIRYLDKDSAEHTLYYNYKTGAYNEESE